MLQSFIKGVTRKGISSMREYTNISDKELKDLCFVNADKKYITNVIENAKKQFENGDYIVVKKDGMDVMESSVL